MALSTYELRTSIAVSDIQEAVAFYEGKLGLPPLSPVPAPTSPTAAVSTARVAGPL